MIISKLVRELKKKIKKEIDELLSKSIQKQKAENPGINYSRNGYQAKQVHTLIGTIELLIPRLRYYTFDYEILEADLMNSFI